MSAGYQLIGGDAAGARQTQREFTQACPLVTPEHLPPLSPRDAQPAFWRQKYGMMRLRAAVLFDFTRISLAAVGSLAVWL